MEETAKRIIDRSTALFMQFGIRSVTMDDIARDLSISKKTIYQYFNDKDEIVFQVTDNHLSEQAKRYDEIARTSENAIEELARISQCLRKDLGEMNPGLLFDLQKYHPRSFDQWLSFKQDYIYNHIVSTLEQGKIEGYFRKEINPSILARLRVEEVELSFNAQHFPRSEFDFVTIQLQLFDHFVHGLVTAKGKSLYESYTQSEKSEVT